MIASVSSGARFAGLARYLASGRSGRDTERVAWTAGRNLFTDDPVLAGRIMQAEAARNVQVDKPVYHVALAFDPNDRVTPEIMRRSAERLLADLGLSEHQAVIVAHRDRAHPHVHLMVNRVHPETGVAWDRSFDYQRIEASLRAQERELGVRVVPGRHAPIPEWETTRDANWGAMALPSGDVRRTKGEERQRLRGDAPFVERIRAELGVIRAADGWRALHDVLAARGLHLERKGQGLVIVGRAVGEGPDRSTAWREVQASRVHRELSLAFLERRFGVPFTPSDSPPEHDRSATRTRAAGGSVRSVADIPLFRVTVRQRLLDVRESRSWTDLADRLGRHGLRLDQSGYGLALTDGVARVRISDLGADARRTALEARFGQPFAEWVRARQRAELGLPEPRQRAVGAREGTALSRPSGATLSPSSRYLAAQLGRYDRLRRIDQLVTRIGTNVSRVAYARQALEGRTAAADRAEAELRRSFGHVYQDPTRAFAQFRQVAERGGITEAAAHLARAPEQFGLLQGEPGGSADGQRRRRLVDRLAQVIGADPTDHDRLVAARTLAANVARQAEEWGTARRQLPASMELDRLRRWEARLRGREAHVRQQYRALETEPVLARRIARVLPRVPAEELDRLSLTLRRDQRAVLGAFVAARAEVEDQRTSGNRSREAHDQLGAYALRDLSARAASLALRQFVPTELRDMHRAVEAIRSPGLAMRRAIGRALTRELLGRDEHAH